MNHHRIHLGLSIMISIALMFLLSVMLPSTASVSADEEPFARTTLTEAMWTSGWQAINPGAAGKTFTHNIGLPPKQLGVELWFRDTDTGAGIHRIAYGGLEYQGKLYGVYWDQLTTTTIRVYRMPNDNAADEILVRVWAMDPPDYESDWEAIAPGNAHYFNHGLRITNTELSVSMWFSNAQHGAHQFSYGGLTTAAGEEGAYWMRLTDEHVVVYRRPDDIYAEQVRVRVTQAPSPDYDSLTALEGWQDIDPGETMTFTHNLNWNPSLLMVQTACYDTAPGGAGIHQLYAGGDNHLGNAFRGTHIQNLTSNTVRIVRRPGDAQCDQVRVRIWRRQQRIYLPLVISN